MYKPSVLGLLQPLSPWLSDGAISEIMLNEPGYIVVERNRCMEHHAVSELHARHLQYLAQLIANESHQILHQDFPLLSASIVNGYRIQLVMPPVTPTVCFSIRKPGEKVVDIASFSSSNKQLITDSAVNLLHGSMVSQLRQAVRDRHHILIAGATSSGKTTLLKACLNYIPDHDRLIIIEDTPELNINHSNMLRMLLPPRRRQSGGIVMSDLLQASLRLRPDRIIIGEVRGREVVDLLMANNTGHRGSLCSIHANNADDALLRLQQLYCMAQPGVDADLVRQQITSAIDTVVFVERKRDAHVIVQVQTV